MNNFETIHGSWRHEPWQKVETPSSFNIGGREIIIPVSVEATGGIRLKLKMPKIFQ
jgi:hypothetical protein